MKKLVRITLFLALIFALSIHASALVAQSESFYVCDDAGVLSSAVEEHIIDMNGALEEQCSGAQIVVVSVAYMDGLYSDEYAYALMNDWGVGNAEEDNGMLLLFATKENRAWLAVGNGIFGTFDEDVAGMYLDNYFWDGYDNQDYDGAVTKLFDALCDWYGNYYSVSAPGGAYSDIGSQYEPEPVGTLWDSEQSVIFNLFVLSIVFLILFSPLILFSLFRTRIRWGHWGIWPIYYFRPWWKVRVPRQRNRPFYNSTSYTNRSSMNGGYSGRSWSGSSSRGSSSRGSWSSGSSHSSGSSWSGGSSRSSGGSSRSSGGFSSHSSGSGHGGGGHSGGGAGRR